jgi:NAD(P)H-hydrate repair Nnr-like enzyme with NAD(P)H-hydrate epimerase domain
VTRRSASAAALLAITAVAAAGCGSSSKNTVDASKVESGIKQQMSSSGAEVTSVKCPSDVKSEAGATFDCDVSWSNGATGKVKVTETSVNHFTYSVVSGSVQVPGSTADAAIEKQLAKQGIPNATVDCPQNIIVKTGTTVTCNLSGAGGKAGGTVTFAWSSAEGTIDPSSVKTG